MGEWSSATLASVGVSLIDCEHRTPPAVESGYPYVAIPQLVRGHISLNDVRLISHEHFVEWTRKARPLPYDVVLSRRCNPGETAYVPEGLDFALGQNLVLLRSDGQQIYPPFLRWLVRGPLWMEQVGAFINVGSVFDSLKCRDIPNFRLPIPPLAQQKCIAYVLGTLDDKIELNRRMNATLEAMSRAIFKSWFVDFDPVRAKAAGRQPEGMDAEMAALFPDSFEESEIGDVPKGWGVGRLNDVAEHPRRAARPGEISVGTPYIGLEHMPRRCIALSEWGEGDVVESNKFKFQRGDILFGKLRPYFHKVGVAPVDGVCSTDIVVARARSPEWFGFALGVMSSDEFVAYTNAGSTGTKMPRTNWDDMSRYEAVLPSESVAEAFTSVVQPAVASIAARIHQSRTLAALRDTLLPKLLSGEVRVPEAEKAVEEAVG
jgi:type I restriction enzyme S subunit